ncbi:MAG TPA: alpha/beta hydrolase [Ramlibacter sp.]|nr:alpha/beta hydrolase [Ramlibacter sp.]
MSAGERLPGTPEPMHVWVTPAGLRIAADSWGDPQAPQVVLVHGGGQSRHAWRATGRNLGAAGYHAVAFDLRGHGDSDWSPEGDYSANAFIGDLAWLVRHLGGRDPVVVGASLGAEVALLAAGEGAAPVAGIAMIDFAPRTEQGGFERLRDFMSGNADGFASLEEVAESISRFRGGAGRPAKFAGLARVVRLGPDGRFRWHWDRRLVDCRVREFPTRHERMAAAARQLQRPALLVRGSGSDVVSEEGAREFLQLCPQAEYIDIADAGHMIVGDRNDIFGQAAAPFLARVLPI